MKGLFALALDLVTVGAAVYFGTKFIMWALHALRVLK